MYFFPNVDTYADPDDEFNQLFGSPPWPPGRRPYERPQDKPLRREVSRSRIIIALWAHECGQTFTCRTVERVLGLPHKEVQNALSAELSAGRLAHDRSALDYRWKAGVPCPYSAQDARARRRD